MTDIFTDSDYHTEPPLTEKTLREAQNRLGYRLPQPLIDLLFERNRGSLVRTTLPVPFSNSWAEDHIAVDGIFGIGGDNGMDTPTGSAYLKREWGYPDIGVVFGITPSAGHDTVMLNYEVLNEQGDPTIAYVDEDRSWKTVASSFEDFLSRLVPEEAWD